ncbi:hypothetical protein TRIATDRAFT_302771 [Trichoderma atroviride IMI 206040]|uniref:Uncharacterized protein n=1 Tax=Hypocrea atroviridis (strain ATCC 20476 / IMI 206040) TaxID=452589 RepID=G9P9W1_HYPAI|nr:uncharacterized protein TRIATDRAFT_302771 [Trichoderma atroviride IMI 206040]EHK40432.1 hypothetical protein TRIATDRAFT_302771 [Trichoderma atroviride IMI 206040]
MDPEAIKRAEKNEDESRDGRGNSPDFAIFSSNEDSYKHFACPFCQRDQQNASFERGGWETCAHNSWKEYHRDRLVHTFCKKQSRESDIDDLFSFLENTYIASTHFQ